MKKMSKVLPMLWQSLILLISMNFLRNYLASGWSHLVARALLWRSPRDRSSPETKITNSVLEALAFSNQWDETLKAGSWVSHKGLRVGGGEGR